MKHWYRIIGLKDWLLEDWLDDMRDDIEIFVLNNGEIVPMIKLTILEAIKLEYQMIMWGRVNNIPIRLKRVKSRC